MPAKKTTKVKTKKIPKTSIKTKKNTSSDLSSAIIISNRKVNKKSDFVLNLKNPNQEKFEEPVAPTISIKKPNNPIKQVNIKPPKLAQARPNDMGVNFITKKFSLPKTKLRLFIKSEKKLKSHFKKEIEHQEEDIEDIFSKPNTYKISSVFSIPKDWYKTVSAFIIMAFLFILPFQAFSYYQELQDTKDKVLLLTNEAVISLKGAKENALSLDLDTASLQFDNAKVKFSLAQEEINQVNDLTTQIIELIPGQGEAVETGKLLLEGGKNLSEVGSQLAMAAKNFLSSQGVDYYQSLQDLNLQLDLAGEHFSKAKTLITQIKIDNIPQEYRQEFQNVLSSLPVVENSLRELKTLNRALLSALGQEQWQRYLLVFTNTNELRANGGFMGSFAILDIDRGQIKKIEIPGGGTYDLQGQLIPKVLAPKPLQLLNTRWEFQDANWWPNFPSSAKKIQWFYQNAWLASTDGVILITSTMMENLLRVVGPINMPDYNRTITDENFVEETQKIVQVEYDKEENRPKKFLADLAPKLIERVFALKGEEFKILIDTLKQGLAEKHFLIYFSDPEIQTVVSSLDWSGELKETEGDYLSVIHTNLAGGKTDSVINEVITHQAEIMADGSVINTVTLTRTHNGPNDGNIFTGVQNNSYVRFYTPSGSSLIEADGFEKPDQSYFDIPTQDLTPDLDLISIETDKSFDDKSGTDIYKEHGKTVFGNWLQIKPGEQKTAYIKYKLPFKLKQEGSNTFYYSLMTQKQSGSLGSKLNSALKLDENYQVLSKFPADLIESQNGVIYSDVLNTDKFYGVTLTTQ